MNGIELNRNSGRCWCLAACFWNDTHRVPKGQAVDDLALAVLRVYATPHVDDAAINVTLNEIARTSHYALSQGIKAVLLGPFGIEQFLGAISYVYVVASHIGAPHGRRERKGLSAAEAG
jgi:hypothetical protein